MASSITPWSRPEFQPTGRRASVTLVAFAGDALPDSAFSLDGGVPANAPVDALDVRQHRYADSPKWIDGFRTDGLRAIAAQQLPDLTPLDAATCCYTVTVEVDDPADLTHLQLAWAVAGSLARAGAGTVLDMHAANWLTGAAVAALPPDRPFTVQNEITITAETDPADGFGHPVHTRGLAKVGRPDLVAGVPAGDIEDTGRILNHLARMLADGAVLTAGQRLRFDGARTLTVADYQPGGAVPQLNLVNDGLLLVDTTAG